MNRVICRLQGLQLRQIVTSFVLAIAFLFIQAFGFESQMLAAALPLTPEASSYQVESDYAGKEQVGTLKEKVENAVDNVVEKLNLNEPLPESTKEFLGQTEDKVDETVEPITGDRGYFKEESQVRK